MKKNIPRIMFSAPKSGEGKTTVVCGILQALTARKMQVSSFKCGPDYIDSLFHREIIGTKSANIDLFFCDTNTVKNIMADTAEDTEISIIEGAMGFYDGIGAVTEKASAYDVAKETQTPVVLIVDAKGTSLSLCALIKGFKDFRDNNKICGVILNKCTPMLLNTLKPIIEKECKTEVLGCMMQNSEYALESRHLGLVTVGEVEEIKNKLNLMAQETEKNINLDRIIEIAKTAPDIELEEIKIKKKFESPIIAVARDKAFCFYYNENLTALEKLGGKIKFFSPLKNEKLPEDTAGIYLGGGYPEIFAKELSKSQNTLQAIKKAADKGMPILAECGGFMYLTEEIDGNKTAAVLKGKCSNTKHLTRFGYITLTARKDNMLCKKNEKINGHEFHYYECSENGESFEAKKPYSKKSWKCINCTENIFAGFPHLYFYSNLSFAENFLKACDRYKKRGEH